MHPISPSLTALLALCILAADATTVHRCEDRNGHITFTHLGCPSDQQLQLHNAYNPPPSGSQAAPATSKKAEKAASKAKPAEQRRAVAGTAERQDGCGNLVTGSVRRKAIIKKEVRAGMTQADVESMLGRPDSVSSQNGKVRYGYVDKRSGRKRSVTFDNDGCVKP
ncbi:MAG: outer membrane protein assembly factor BamE [Pseudomonas sp.]